MPIEIAALVRSKCLKLLEYCVELERTLAGADASRRRAVERLVQLIVEAIADMGAALAEGASLRSPGSTREAIAIMREAGFYPGEEARRFEERYVSLRNRIVHDYEEVDFRLVESNAARLIADARAIARGLEEKLEEMSA